MIKWGLGIGDWGLGAQSERHNRRDADYIASLNPAMLYIRKDLAHQNEVYVAPDMVGVSLQQHYEDIRVMVKQKTGRAMQEKDVKFTDKKALSARKSNSNLALHRLTSWVAISHILFRLRSRCHDLTSD